VLLSGDEDAKTTQSSGLFRGNQSEVCVCVCA